MEHHQREQAVGLGVVGNARLARQQLDERPRQPDRLVTKLLADQRVARGGSIALVEDEVEDSKHPVEPLGQQGERRHTIGDAGVADLALRPHQSLRHGRRRHKKSGRDLGGGEAAQGAQGQRHARLQPQRGVATSEEEPQPLVGELRVLVPVLILQRASAHPFEGGEGLELFLLAGKRGVAAEAVDGLAPGDTGEPGRRIARDACDGPLPQGGDAGVLQRVLGQCEVARGDDERGQDAAGLLAEDPLDDARDLFHRSPKTYRPVRLRTVRQRGGPARGRPTAAL